VILCAFVRAVSASNIDRANVLTIENIAVNSLRPTLHAPNLRVENMAWKRPIQNSVAASGTQGSPLS